MSSSELFKDFWAKAGIMMSRSDIFDGYLLDVDDELAMSEEERSMYNDEYHMLMTAKCRCTEEVTVIDHIGLTVNEYYASQLPPFSNVPHYAMDEYDMVRASCIGVDLDVSEFPLADLSRDKTSLRSAISSFFGFEGAQIIQVGFEDVSLYDGYNGVVFPGAAKEFFLYIMHNFHEHQRDVDSSGLNTIGDVTQSIIENVGVRVKLLDRVVPFQNLVISGTIYEQQRAKYYEQLGDAYLEVYAVRTFHRIMYETEVDFEAVRQKIVSNRNLAQIIVNLGLSEFFYNRLRDGKELADIFEIIVGLYAEQVNFNREKMDEFFSSIGFDIMSSESNKMEKVAMDHQNNNISTRTWRKGDNLYIKRGKECKKDPLKVIPVFKGLIDYVSKQRLNARDMWDMSSDIRRGLQNLHTGIKTAHMRLVGDLKKYGKRNIKVDVVQKSKDDPVVSPDIQGDPPDVHVILNFEDFLDNIDSVGNFAGEFNDRKNLGLYQKVVIVSSLTEAQRSDVSLEFYYKSAHIKVEIKGAPSHKVGRKILYWKVRDLFRSEEFTSQFPS